MLRKIKVWAGHANLSTTQRYMHLAPAERAAAAAIDALDAATVPSRPLRIV